jgi:hypothetical protein
LSSKGDSVQLRNPSGTIIDTLTVPPAPSDQQRFLRVTELHYRPLPISPDETGGDPFATTSDFEFIELINTSTTTLDISGASFSNGITWTFPQGTSLAPSQRIVVSRRPSALALRSHNLHPDSVFGPFTGSLDNAGERITLRDAAGEQILSFVYDNNAPWPAEPDGTGPSLVLISPSLDPDLAENWRPSTSTHGNPTTSDSIPFTGNPDADADLDGIPALLEYALGTSDSSPSPAPTPEFSPVNRTLSLVHASAADAAALTIESSPDLASWASPGDLTRLGSNSLPGGLTRTTWSLTATTNTPRLFTRTRATLR